jgi:hypothetical protein
MLTPQWLWPRANADGVATAAPAAMSPSNAKRTLYLRNANIDEIPPVMIACASCGARAESRLKFFGSRR